MKKRYKIFRTEYYDGYSVSGENLIQAIDDFCLYNKCDRKDVSITTFDTIKNYDESCSKFLFTHQRLETDEELDLRIKNEKTLQDMMDNKERLEYERLKRKFENG